ncbi:hypothetical protein NP493_17g06024 [Ridgeia piscesae]|uniref:Ricin B lectin domain-containing protein n=1 Tax=Ridgeia piscesae TaxID=27915 RepID=A0AAD9UKV9_RIDPI|nr:hypothetical protein NP493_17g06024 [Ridgeia piscesae]
MPAFAMQMEPRTGSVDWSAYIPMYKMDMATKWIHWKGGPLKIFKRNLCLEASENFEISLAPCNYSNPLQQWTFQNYTAEWTTVLQDRRKIHNLSAYMKTLITSVRASSLGLI